MRNKNGDGAERDDYDEAFDALEKLIHTFQDRKKRDRTLLFLEYLKRAAYRLPPREKLVPATLAVTDTSGALILYKHYREVVEALLINGFLKFLIPERADPVSYAQSLLGISIKQEDKDSLKQGRDDLWILGFLHDIQICVAAGMERIFPKIGEIFKTVIDQACDEVIAETLNDRYHHLHFQDKIHTQDLLTDVQKRATKVQQNRLKARGGPPKGRGKVTSRIQLQAYVKAAILDYRERSAEPIEQKDVVAFLNKINGKDFCTSVRQFTGWLKMFNLKWTELLEKYDKDPTD